MFFRLHHPVWWYETISEKLFTLSQRKTWAKNMSEKLERKSLTSFITPHSSVSLACFHPPSIGHGLRHDTHPLCLCNCDFPWPSPPETPKLLVDLITSAAIPLVLPRIDSSMPKLRVLKVLQAVRACSCLISSDKAWHKRGPAQDVADKSDMHNWHFRWPRTGLIKLNTPKLALHRISRRQFRALEGWEVDKWNLKIQVISSWTIGSEFDLKQKLRPTKHDMFHIINDIKVFGVPSVVWKGRNCGKTFLDKRKNQRKKQAKKLFSLILKVFSLFWSVFSLVFSLILIFFRFFAIFFRSFSRSPQYFFAQSHIFSLRVWKKNSLIFSLGHQLPDGIKYG